MNRPAPHHEAAGPNVLHVIDLPGAGWDALAAAARCARELPARQRLLLIGDRHAQADAASLGLVPDRSVSPPLGTLATAVAPLDRAFAELDRQTPVEAVHVWSDSARVLCRQTLGYAVPIVQEEPGPLAAPAPIAQRALLRARLGIADDECAVLLATDRAGVGDARRFAGLVGILQLADIPTVGVASNRSNNYRRAARFLRGFGRAWDVIPVSGPPAALVAAADAVMYDQGDTLSADGGPGTPTGGTALSAALAGIPVVTTTSEVGRSIAGPLQEQVLTRHGLLPEFARVLVPLCESRERRLEVGAALRRHARSVSRPLSGVLDRWRAAALAEAPA